VIRITVCSTFVTLAIAFPSSAAQLTPFDRIPAGPALAGDGVVWVEQVNSTASVAFWRPGRGGMVVSRFASDGFLSLAASGSRVILARNEDVCAEGQPCVAREDAVAGPRAGPLRAVSGARSCTAQYPSLASVDMDGTIAAYAQPRCAPRRVLVVDLGHRPTRVRFSISTSADRARLAGRFLALPARGSIVLYDWKAGRVAYRYPAPVNVTDFDLQADGKVVILSDESRVAWFSPAQPRGHFFRYRGAADFHEVRMARNRIAFARQVNGDESDLVVADLAGHLTRIARFVGPDRLTRDFVFHSDIGFDGRSVAWASDHVTHTAVICPPPPSAAPCRTYASGVRTIWRELLWARPKPVVRLPFDESAKTG
jgi:hypothetical protein